jgi:hypothetical protein
MHSLQPLKQQHCNTQEPCWVRLLFVTAGGAAQQQTPVRVPRRRAGHPFCGCGRRPLGRCLCSRASWCGRRATQRRCRGAVTGVPKVLGSPRSSRQSETFCGVALRWVLHGPPALGCAAGCHPQLGKRMDRKSADVHHADWASAHCEVRGAESADACLWRPKPFRVRRCAAS